MTPVFWFPDSDAEVVVWQRAFQRWVTFLNGRRAVSIRTAISSCLAFCLINDSAPLPAGRKCCPAGRTLPSQEVCLPIGNHFFAACFKLIAMNFRNTRLNTTCLYSEDSTLREAGLRYPIMFLQSLSLLWLFSWCFGHDELCSDKLGRYCMVEAADFAL